jgi:hypothetical protein
MKLVYKFYDVDNHQAISDEVYNYVVNYSDILTSNNPTFFNDVSIPSMLAHTPLLRDFLQQRLLDPRQISVVVVPADMKPYLHVDTIDPYVRILWPVKNCMGARTKFFDIPRECLKLDHNSEASTNIYFKITESRDWPSLGEVELTQPVIFDASVAHAVHPAPGATEHRISFTMGFDRDLPISKSVKSWFGFQR